MSNIAILSTILVIGVVFYIAVFSLVMSMMIALDD